jgi:hypothetical protein
MLIENFQHKLRRTRYPLLAKYLLTSDTILGDDSQSTPTNPLASPPRSHPPPLYYLPAKLTPAQEAFLAKRKQEVQNFLSLFARFDVPTGLRSDRA